MEKSEANNQPQLHLYDLELHTLLEEIKQELLHSHNTEALLSELQRETMATQSKGSPALTELKAALLHLKQIETNDDEVRQSSRISELKHELYRMAIQNYLDEVKSTPGPSSASNTFLFLGCFPMLPMQAWRRRCWTWVRNLMAWTRIGEIED